MSFFYPRIGGTASGMANTTTIWTDWFFGAATPSSVKGMKVWNGSAWVMEPAKVWSGSGWVAKPVKVWDGGAW